MKVTMIGASGFVGTRLIDLLKNEPERYEMKNIDLLPSLFQRYHCDWRREKPGADE